MTDKFVMYLQIFTKNELKKDHLAQHEREEA